MVLEQEKRTRTARRDGTTLGNLPRAVPALCAALLQAEIRVVGLP